MFLAVSMLKAFHRAVSPPVPNVFERTPANRVRYKMLYPRRHLRNSEQERLKHAIRRRLTFEDYACRLPKDKVRYRLKRELILHGGFVMEVYR